VSEQSEGEEQNGRDREGDGGVKRSYSKRQWESDMRDPWRSKNLLKRWGGGEWNDE